MDEAFNISTKYNDQAYEAEIRPNSEDDVPYYDVWKDGEYQFTLSSTHFENIFIWKVSPKNADKHVDPILGQLIGNEIQKIIE